MVSTQNRSLQRSGTPPPSGLQPSMTDVQSLVRVQHIEGDRTPREWISLLATVDKVDEEEQAARKKLGRNSLLLLLGGIVSLALVPVAPFIGVPLGAALLGGAVLQSRSYFFHKRLCLGRDLSRFVLPFLAVLREEMKPGASLHLRMDLHGSVAPQKKARQDPPRTSPGGARVVDTHYADPWIEGEGVLADGARLRWDILDEVCVSHRTKRSASGKTKIKTRHSQRTHLSLQLALPEALYALPGAEAGSSRGVHGPPSQSRVSIKPGDKRSTIKLKRTLKFPQVAPLDLPPLLDLLAEAYRMAAPNPVPTNQSASNQVNP